MYTQPLQADIRLQEQKKRKLQSEINRLQAVRSQTAQSSPFTSPPPNEVGLLEKKKRQLLSDIERLNTVKSQAIKPSPFSTSSVPETALLDKKKRSLLADIARVQTQRHTMLGEQESIQHSINDMLKVKESLGKQIESLMSTFNETKRHHETYLQEQSVKHESKLKAEETKLAMKTQALVIKGERLQALQEEVEKIKDALAIQSQGLDKKDLELAVERKSITETQKDIDIIRTNLTEDRRRAASLRQDAQNIHKEAEMAKAHTIRYIDDHMRTLEEKENSYKKQHTEVMRREAIAVAKEDELVKRSATLNNKDRWLNQREQQLKANIELARSKGINI